MSKQLTLADVEAGRYVRILDEDYWYAGALPSGLVHVLSKQPHGGVQHIRMEAAKKMKVELMELVPKDRDSDLLEALEGIVAKPDYTDPESMIRKIRAAITEHKGESA